MSASYDICPVFGQCSKYQPRFPARTGVVGLLEAGPLDRRGPCYHGCAGEVLGSYAASVLLVARHRERNQEVFVVVC